MAFQIPWLIAALFVVGAGWGAEPRAPSRKPAAVPVISVKRRIDTLLSTEAGKNAKWGIHVVSLKTGAVVYERNSTEHFTPASNTKLFSTALALERLGPDHRFVTTLMAERAPDANGRLEGDLRLVGGGDPTLSGREYPYRKDSDVPNPLEPIEQLAAQLIQRGVQVITGDIVGDDRLFVNAPYPEGWTVDDTIWEYGAPVSALPFNDSAFTLVVRPGAEVGDLARIAVNPPSLPLLIDNRVSTTENGRSDVQIERAPGSRQVRVYGTVSQKGRGVRQLLAVDDAALFAAHVLYDVLTRRGVRVQGAPQALHRYLSSEAFDRNSGVELARRTSAPLADIAQVVDKVSQNLHAEILMREVARVRREEATREAGLKELSQFLDQIGVPSDAYHFEDGSGLSRRTLVAPAAITKLLVYMDGRNREVWDGLLPIGGEDGSLSTRFEKSPRAAAIHAKTGTLATVSALSGYITTRSKARLAFSIIANNHTLPSGDVRKVIDRIGLALIDWEGN